MKIYQIAVMQGWMHQFAQDVLAGAVECFRTLPSANVEVIQLPWRVDDLKENGSSWKIDGLIAPIISEQLYKIVKHLGWKCVSTHIGVQWPEIPQVDVDHQATGIMAADHLIEQGFEHFAWAGSDSFRAMTLRRDGFIQQLQKKGIQTFTLEFKDSVHSIEHKEIITWLQQLPKPCAVYCQDDMCALYINSLCRELGIHVPDGIALLGNQNSELLCEGMQPSLSSTHLPYRKIGFTAAQLLYDWLAHDKKPDAPIVLPPSHVEIRSSTETLAIDDPQLRKVIRYLRDHCTERDLSMEDAARHAGLSLRDMQRKFKQKLGHPPSFELRRARIQTVRKLLRDTTLPLEELAWRCGYPSANYLCAQFRQITGMTPGEYRKQT